MIGRVFLFHSAPALLLGLLFFGCANKEDRTPPSPPPQRDSVAAPSSADTRILATVNGDPITLAEFQERLVWAGLKPVNETETAIKRDFLNRLIERKMLLREAQRKRIKISLADISARIESLKSDPRKDVREILSGQGIDFEKWKSEIWENLMIERLLALQVTNKISVSQAEIRNYYRKHEREFDLPEQVRVRQIVVTTETEAEKIRELLRENTDFAELARERSIGPEAGAGGDLGYFGRGDMPPEFNVVFDLPKSGLSGVVKSPYGFHLFKVIDKRPAGKAGLDQVAGQIREKLAGEKQSRRYQEWIQELRSRTRFEVNYSALEH